VAVDVRTDIEIDRPRDVVSAYLFGLAPRRGKTHAIRAHESAHALKRVLRARLWVRIPAANRSSFGIFRVERLVKPTG